MIAMAVGAALALLALGYVLYPLLAWPSEAAPGRAPCPSCGELNTPGAIYCSGCGAALQRE